MTLTCSSLAGDLEVLSRGSFCMTGDVQMKGATSVLLKFYTLYIFTHMHRSTLIFLSSQAV